MNKKIVIIDDHPDLLEILSNRLKEEGFSVSSYTNPLKGWDAIQAQPPDLLLLDIRMKEMDGLTLLKKLKSNPKTQHVMVILVSVKSQESDVIVGLEMGADDYIAKPVRHGILMARLKAVMRRRKEMSPQENLEIGPLKIDFSTYKVTIHNKILDLRPKEFQLLAYLAKNEGRVVTRNSISHHVWDRNHIPNSKTIEYQMHGLRKKLGAYQAWINALPGVGYRFEI